MKTVLILSTVVAVLAFTDFFGTEEEESRKGVGSSTLSGVYVKSVTSSFNGNSPELADHTAKSQAMKRIETIDLRKTGEFVWAYEHYMSGVKNMELEEQWDGTWKEKGNIVELTYVFKPIPHFDAELNAKARARTEGIWRFSIEPNGDLLLIGRNSEVYSIMKQERFARQ